MDDRVFDGLFVLDMANNHQGSLQHGLAIIEACSAVCHEKGIRAGIKFQYRHLSTFIHPDHVQGGTSKHIPRFLGTRLDDQAFRRLADEAKRRGLLTISTPFDEESVDLIEEHRIEVIKIASCSAKDWPLLEQVAKARKPVICSTGGCDTGDIDRVVSFFSHRGIPLAIMHCVAIYPTPEEDLQLNQIDFLRRRYPFLPVGFSTHERPDNLEAVQVAVAKGAQILERHVGLAREGSPLNAYSSDPARLAAWIESAKRARTMCGARERLAAKWEEIDSLRSLQRGAFAKRELAAGESFGREDMFLAMPLLDGMMDASVLSVHSMGFIADRDYRANEPLSPACIRSFDSRRQIYSVIHQVKALLYEGRIAIGREFEVSLSHHYGIELFHKVGAVVIDCINREYCKKLIVVVPGQWHPTHYHKQKEETFQVLYGDLVLTIDGDERILRPGDQMLVDRGQRHSFTTKRGVVFEEVSTTHHMDDSFYEDPRIVSDAAMRKTRLADARHTFEQYDFAHLQ